MAFNTTLDRNIDSALVSNKKEHVYGGVFVFFTYSYTALVFVSIICFPFVFNYITTWLFFQISHVVSETAMKVPPTVPYMVPILGSTFNFVFNGLDFVHKAT